MATQTIDSRIKLKTDTTANWRAATSFIPLKGELIVYSDYETKTVEGETINIPNFKIGDGLAYGIDLPFVDEKLRDELNTHIANTSIHVTAAEKQFWNNKVRCYASPLDNTELVFTTN